MVNEILIGARQDHQKEFIKIISTMDGKYATWEIWSDFVTIAAITISNVLDTVRYDRREQTYRRIASKYDKAELEKFAELMAITVMALGAKPNQDFLGELYMALNLGSHWKGQFFTPYSVCELSAKTTCTNMVERIKEEGYINVCDPACGAGALLIAAANLAMTECEDINWQNHIAFYAQDIDMITGMMCYIQLSLLGCAGAVKIADTLANPMTDGEAESELTNPNSSYWYTPMYFSDVWRQRFIWRSINRLLRAEPKAKQIHELSEEANGQLILT